MISRGKNVRIAYDLTINGKLVRSVHQNKPFKYTHGRKQLPVGLEKALSGLKVGDKKQIVLSPENGYGAENPKSVMEMSKKRFPKRDHFIGKEVKSLKDGTYLATVREVRKDTLVLDFNHPYAGKKLVYEMVIVSIEGEGYIRS